MRTSAGPALAVQYLQPNCKELVVFGAGAQAKCHIGLIELALKRRIPKITIINRTIQNANSLREIILEEQRMTNRHAGCYDIDGGDTVSTIDTVALNDLDGVKNALSTADVICTTTNTISPLWDGQAVSLQKGCLITSIGSYTPDMQEIPSDVVDQCHVVIDTPETLSVGDLKHLSASVDDDFITLAGDVFSNPQALLDKFKIDPQKDYMFYKAVGTAIQDVLTAKAVVENARRLGLGQDVDMS
jgi:ornithine cyclodeaminase